MPPLKVFACVVATAVAAGAGAPAAGPAADHAPVTTAVLRAAVVADARPATGAALVRRGARGAGVLRIHNGSADDAVVTLSDGARAVREVYVRANDSTVVGQVADGAYDVYTMFGSGWDGAARRFTVGARFERLDARAAFTSRRTRGGLRYSEVRLTLRPATGGNTAVVPVAAAAYPR